MKVTGSTLEMRQFGVTGLRAHLIAAGFREVSFFNEDQPAIGILFDQNVSAAFGREEVSV